MNPNITIRRETLRKIATSCVALGDCPIEVSEVTHSDGKKLVAFLYRAPVRISMDGRQRIMNEHIGGMMHLGLENVPVFILDNGAQLLIDAVADIPAATSGRTISN